VLANVVNNLAENSLDIQEVIADTGYSSEVALRTLTDHNIQGYIPNASGYKENRDGFIYDAEKDRYSCPNGKYLAFRHLRKKDDNTHKIYKTRVNDCCDCPFKTTCANPAGIKSLEDSISKPLYDQMHWRMRTQKGKLMRRLRSSTVELVLGTLINFTAMSQVYTKGISLAGKGMIMAAVAYNLKKLINGILGDLRKNIRKSPGNGFQSLKNTLLASLNSIQTLISCFKINDKNKWLNNHLLCKLNYSAI
jgi:hypothetical protein